MSVRTSQADPGRALPSPGTALGVIGVLIAAAVGYRDTIRVVLGAWAAPDPAYQHAWAVMLISGVIAYRQWRAAGPRLAPRPSIPAAFLLVIASIAWGVTTLVAVEAMQLLSFALVVVLIVPSLLGFRVARRFAIPIGLFVVTLPFWDLFKPYLQVLTARAATQAVAFTGTPVYRDGTDIFVSAGKFIVSPDCSGLMYTLSGMLAGLLFAYVRRLSCIATAAVTAGAALVASIGNVLRIAIVIYLGEATRMQHVFVAEDHSVFGWFVYAACTIAFLLLASRYTRRPRAVPDVQGHPMPERAGDRGGFVRSAVLTLVALGVGPAIVHAYQPHEGRIEARGLRIPTVIAGWHAEPPPFDADRPSMNGPDAESYQSYRDGGGRRIHLYVADFDFQGDHKKAISRSNAYFDAHRWKPVQTGLRAGSDGWTASAMLLQSTTGETRLLWRWYYVHGRSTGSDYLAKLANAWGTLRNDPAVAVIVASVDVPADGDATGAEVRLGRFVADAKPQIQAAIDQRRPPR